MNRHIGSAASSGRIAGSVLLLGIAVLAAGCGHNRVKSGAAVAGPCTDPVDHNVKVLFDAQGCPTDVEVEVGSRCTAADKRCLKASNAKPRIRWYSEPAGVKFGVFFDPLMGPQYVANGGCVRKKLNTNVPPVPGQPAVEYKYTIASMGSGKSLDRNCPALDPKVIVEH